MFDLALRHCVFDHPKKPACRRIFIFPLFLYKMKRILSNGFQTQGEPREVCHGDGGTHFPCFIKSLVSRLLCGGTMGAAILPIQPIIRHFYKPNAHIQVGTLLPP